MRWHTNPVDPEACRRQALTSLALTGGARQKWSRQQTHYEQKRIDHRPPSKNRRTLPGSALLAPGTRCKENYSANTNPCNPYEASPEPGLDSDLPIADIGQPIPKATPARNRPGRDSAGGAGSTDTRHLAFLSSYPGERARNPISPSPVPGHSDLPRGRRRHRSARGNVPDSELRPAQACSSGSLQSRATSPETRLVSELSSPAPANPLPKAT